MVQNLAPPAPPYTPPSQALASPAPPHTPLAAFDCAAPTQKAPTAPAKPFTDAVQSDTTTSTDPAPASVQSDTTSPAGVSVSLPARHGGDAIRESPKKESHKRKSEENKLNTREVLKRKAKGKRKDRVDKMRKKAEVAAEQEMRTNAERKEAAEQEMRANAERKVAAEQEMRARQNEKEMHALDSLIAEAQDTMDLGIEDID